MKIVSNITRKEAEECISRQCVLDKIQRLIDAERNNIDENGDYMNYARERVNAYEAIQFFVENDCLCPSVTPQEPKIKVLERDEAMRKLGAVDIYQARAWITLLNDLEYLKLKICEVEE